MNIGLYHFKYKMRIVLASLLPVFRKVNPNVITLLIFPFGILTAVATYLAILFNSPVIYFLVVFTLFARIFLSTFDGLLAEFYKKQTYVGELINRIMPEIADISYLLAIAVSSPKFKTLSVIVISIAWLTSFVGIIPLLVNKPIQSIGPTGQTDRLVVFLISMLLCGFIAPSEYCNFIITSFLYYCIVGGIITVVIRLKKVFDDVL